MSSATAARAVVAAPARQARRPAPRGLVAGLFGVGAALPERTITNAELETRLDTTDAWIVRRTGIRERRHLAPDEPLAGLAAEACAAALADAGREADEIDQIIVSTITADRVTPGLAPEVALRIGARRAAAVDINAACAGFVYALDQAAAACRAPMRNATSGASPGVTRSAVMVETMMWSTSSASRPASASAAAQASAARPASGSSGARWRRSRMPVRRTIQASVVASRVSSSALVTVRPGSAAPTPKSPATSPRGAGRRAWRAGAATTARSAVAMLTRPPGCA